MLSRTGTSVRTRVRAVLTLATAVAAGLFAAGRAGAAPNLTFTLTPQSGEGRIHFNGGSGALFGDTLGVSSVKGLSTPSHADAVLPLADATLQFKTGGLVAASPVGPAAAGPITTEWDFGPGGSLELDGGISTLGIAPGTKLITGTFSNQSFVKSLGAGDLHVQGGAFVNVVDPTLAAYYGLPTGGTMYLGGLATLFAAPSASITGFSSTSVTSGSLTTQPVPEPGSLLVLAALSAGGLALRHRRRNRARV
jgi:hypothetical protein